MANITPQDLSSSKSVLDFLLNFAILNNNTEMRLEVERLLNDYRNVIQEPDLSDLTMLPYNRRDAYSILEYLKLQAEQLSNGKWTDFSDADIGTVFLKLMSYLADMNNFQIDKVASELYLSTCTERASAIALCSLIGYEPRHYMSAKSRITLNSIPGQDIPNGTQVPAYSIFTNGLNDITYVNLDESYFYNNEAVFDVYEGTPIVKNYTIDDISTLGRIVLPHYNIGTNTIRVSINGIGYRQVDDVRFISGELGFSVHISEDRYLYIQLPSWWPDVVTRNSSIQVTYLLSNGESGRIGKNVLTRIKQLNSDYVNNMIVAKQTASTGGYNPETVDEMRISVPKRARTMNTIVTINDFEDVGKEVLGIADISALDYNDPSSGLVQPDDYYKVYLYVLPDVEQYDPYDEEQTKYRNTIIKERRDFTYEDMNKVAAGSDMFAKASIQGNSIVLPGAATVYPLPSDIILGVDTGIESTSYLAYYAGSGGGAGFTADTLTYFIARLNDGWILTLNSNWRDQVADTDKLVVYYKQEQVLTEKGQALREYIDERRLTSLNVTYHPLDIVQPVINVELYMDKNDIRFKSVEAEVLDFIVNTYSRKNVKIGEPIFASKIGADILNNFDYIRYCEVGLPTKNDDLIEVLPRGFIDVVPYTVNSNTGEVTQKINVQVFDYQNKVI